MTIGSPESLPLLHGSFIPPIGVGTWPLVEEQCQAMVETALKVGYRLIDTSHKYDNEDAVGAALRAVSLPREDLFITSKFNKEDHSITGVERAYDASLKRLGLDYLDLFLCHWPVPALDRFVEAWKGLVKLREEGRVKAIGVSNFKPAHIDRIVAATGYVPDVNQIQLSVDLARGEPQAYHEQHGIRTQAWSPLGRGPELRDDPRVVAVAEKIGRSPAQVLLRWHVQQGIVPVPRADKTEHLTQNFNVFDFEIPSEEMVVLAAMDRGEAAARDSDAPENGH